LLCENGADAIRAGAISGEWSSEKQRLLGYIYIFIISNLVHEVLDEFPKHNSGAVFFWNQSRVYKNTCKQGVWKIGMIIEGFQLFKV